MDRGAGYAMAGMAIYHAVAVATFGYLTFFDGVAYNWWNWIVMIGLNAALAEMWPIYWALLHWIF